MYGDWLVGGCSKSTALAPHRLRRIWHKKYKHGTKNSTKTALMSRRSLTPVALNLGMVITFTMSLSATSLFSTGVHQSGDTVYSMIACTALITVVSQCSYYTITLLQLLYAKCQTKKRLRDRLRALQQARPLSDEREQENNNSAILSYFLQTCTISEVLCNTIDFKRKHEQIRLWISREDLWRVFYLFSFGVYGCFFAFPTYDPVCTTCFAAGVFVSGLHVEVLRGKFWKRPHIRSVLLGAVALIGIVAFVVTVSIGYLAMLKNTNRSFERATSSQQVQKHVQHALLNSSKLLAETMDLPTNSSWTHELLHSEIIAQLTHNEPRVEGNDRQFVTWFLHAYPYRSWPLWVICLFSPFLLAQMPQSLRLPVLLETVQIPTTCIALAVLAYTSLDRDSPVLEFISVQTALGNMYLLMGSTCTWICAFSACYLLRQRCFLSLTAPLLLVSYAKSAHMLHDVLWRHEAMPLATFAGCICVLYVLLLAYFYRAESIAVRTGWGRHSSSGAGDDDLCDSEEDTQPGIFSVQDEYEREVELRSSVAPQLRSAMVHGFAEEPEVDEEPSEALVQNQHSPRSFASTNTADTTVRAAV